MGVFYAVSTLLNDTVTKYFDYEVKLDLEHYDYEHYESIGSSLEHYIRSSLKVLSDH